MAPEDVMYARFDWFASKFRDVRWWVDGVLGEMYTARGEMGRLCMAWSRWAGCDEAQVLLPTYLSM